MRSHVGRVALLSLLTSSPGIAGNPPQNHLVDIATIPLEQRMESVCTQAKELEGMLRSLGVGKEPTGRLWIIEGLSCTPYRPHSN
jgi:hypothetical protein